MTGNAGIDTILADNITDETIENLTVNDLRITLGAALVARDEEILDHLRMAAAHMGLGPAQVALVLLQIPLGAEVDPHQVEYMVRSAQNEQTQMQAQLHAHMHRLTGTECQCERPEPS